MVEAIAAVGMPGLSDLGRLSRGNRAIMSSTCASMMLLQACVERAKAIRLKRLRYAATAVECLVWKAE